MYSYCVCADATHVRMTMRFAILLTLLWLTGCAVATPTPVVWMTAYAVDISPAFTGEQQSQIIAAADAWSATGAVQLSVTIRDCTPFAIDGEFCIHPASAPANPMEDGDTTWDPQLQNAYVAIFLDSIPYTGNVQQVALHELGHAMGLVHAPGLVVMNAVLSGEAIAPTAADIQALASR